LETAEGPPSDARGGWIAALARDLQKHRGASLVIAGEQQPPIVHALAHLLNDTLDNVGQTIFYTDSAQANPVQQLESLRELVTEMKAGAVETLLILGGNPAYTAPADFEFAEHLPRVRRSIHLGLHLDETSALCTWHIPETHFLEQWGDARAFDGTVSMIQPLIAPLYGGKSAHELLGAMLQQQPIRGDYEIVRAYWQRQNAWPDFEKGWRKTLHDGFIEGSALQPRSVRIQTQNFNATPRSEIGNRQTVLGSLELVFRPDSNVWDGRFANNGWLQELPRPLSKLSWDNAAQISPALAEKLRLSTGDVVELRMHGRSVRAPVWVMPGQAENSVSLTLGYGRSRAGQTGNGIGLNAYPLRTSNLLWSASNLSLTKTGARHLLVSTQLHHGLDAPERQIHRGATLAEFLANPDAVRRATETPPVEQTLYAPHEFQYRDGKWGMTIDLSSCIGCNACLLACQAENNIPVVGKDQIARGRDMFWIRIDTYYKGSPDAPDFLHMPVPCMHCENAPCELVCPVAATVHDHEGLNVQVYNRCIGTRYCSNNCPYKVRRFNFFQYANYSRTSYQPMYNPEVTVRWRGVMEKCTYCVQRISAARIIAKEENRRVRDGEVKTACQQACPAEAIIFGDLNDPTSRVSQMKKHPLEYSMLGELNTRPRTTYLAKLVNPDTEDFRAEPVSKG
jgi:molybdopterin-containing oxidoreductase family iron-sulfur binding subunit